MSISEQELRKIVTEILQTLEKEGYLTDKKTEIMVSKKQAYVLCEVDNEKEFLSFLRKNKDTMKIQVTAIMENQNNELIDTLVKEQLCQTIQTVDGNASEDIKLSIYPSMRRSALCEAGLGMDKEFTSMWLRKDFELGRKSVILVGGIEPFTGMEPIFYQELILSYLKNLIKMDVRLVEKEDEILKICEEIDKR